MISARSVAVPLRAGAVHHRLRSAAMDTPSHERLAYAVFLGGLFKSQIRPDNQEGCLIRHEKRTAETCSFAFAVVVNVTASARTKSDTRRMEEKGVGAFVGDVR